MVLVVWYTTTHTILIFKMAVITSFLKGQGRYWFIKCTCCPSKHTYLTHWSWETHICVAKLIIIISDNVLSSVRRQAIIWNNVGILLIGPLGTHFSEILIGIQIFSFTKMSSAKWRPLCLGLNVLNEDIVHLIWSQKCQHGPRQHIQ